MSRRNFKPGDLVRYVSPHHNSKLEVGEVYEVAERSTHSASIYVFIDGEVHRASQSLWRFEMVEAADYPHVGQWSVEDVTAYLAESLGVNAKYRRKVNGWFLDRGHLFEAIVQPPTEDRQWRYRHGGVGR